MIEGPWKTKSFLHELVITYKKCIRSMVLSKYVRDLKNTPQYHRNK